jgi:ABC-2 type transport system ATP-binding protein
MKQRVSLARALVHDPELLIMDEPANGLDPRARIELRELVKVLAEQGKAILVSSHILTELAEMCSSVVIIEKGRLLSGGALEEISRKADPGTHLSLRAAAGVAQDALVRALLETPGVTRAVPRGASVAVALEGGEEAVAALLPALVARGIPIVECRVEAANLEDVFMNVTKGDIA